MAAVRRADQRLVCCGEPLLRDALLQLFASVHVYEQMSVRTGAHQNYITLVTTGMSMNADLNIYIIQSACIMCILNFLPLIMILSKNNTKTHNFNKEY